MPAPEGRDDGRARLDELGTPEPVEGVSAVAQVCGGDGEEVFERARVLERAPVDRIEARVADQLLHERAGLVVRGEEVARPRVLLVDLVVDAREVEVERLRHGTVRPGLHLVREQRKDSSRPPNGPYSSIPPKSFV